MNGESALKRLFKKHKELKEQWDIISNKISQLRNAYAVEHDITIKIKYNSDIDRSEAERDKIEQKLVELENEIRSLNTNNRVEILLEGKFDSFNIVKKNSLVTTLAELFEIDEQFIKILKIEQGSIQVIIELPEVFANELVNLFNEKSRKIQILHDQLHVVDIQLINNSRETEQIEFVNRVSEIQNITESPAAPYLILSAPAGYGKSRLLENISDQLESDGWLVLNVDLKIQQALNIKDIALLSSG